MRSPAPSISANPANVIRSKDIAPFVVDFDRAPFLVIWEVTRACALACIHCRADAIARRDPRELSTEEGFFLIDQIRSFGSPPPVFVLTGGDPMWRKDLADIVGYAPKAGLTVALTPSGTATARPGKGSALLHAMIGHGLCRRASQEQCALSQPLRRGCRAPGLCFRGQELRKGGGALLRG